MSETKTIREVAEEFGSQMKKIGEHTVKINILHIINSTEEPKDAIKQIKEYLGE